MSRTYKARYPYTSSMTRKGQVTVPVHIRRMLGLMPRDRVAFLVTDGTVRIAPARGVIVRTAGMLKGIGPALSPRDEKASVEDAMAVEAHQHPRQRWHYPSSIPTFSSATCGKMTQLSPPRPRRFYSASRTVNSPSERPTSSCSTETSTGFLEFGVVRPGRSYADSLGAH